MQVNCPNCGAKVTAENINIHKMTAVCGACDTVFSFDLPESKIKRRKIKQPVKLAVRDAESLHMEFPANFRTGRNETVAISLVGTVVMLGMAGMMASTGRVPLFLPALFLSIAAACAYALVLTIVNKTHIEMDED